MKLRILSSARLSFPLASALAGLLAAPSATAASGTWLGADGDWNNPATWVGGTIAAGTGSTANFTGVDIAADRTITLTVPQTIGNITFTDATTASNNLVISGASLLTLDVSSGAPAINVTQSGRTLTINSQIAGNDGLQKTGTGALTLNGSTANTLTGGLNVNGGTLTLDYTNLASPTNLVAATNALQINKGTLTITGKNVAAATTVQTFASTSLGAGLNTVNIAKGASATSATLNLGALTVASGSSTIFSPTTIWTTTASTTEIVKISAGGVVPILPTGVNTAFVNAGVFHRVAGGAAGSLRLAAVDLNGQLLLKGTAGNVADATTINNPTGTYQFGLNTNAQYSGSSSIYGLLLNATSTGLTLSVANSGTLTLNSVIQIKASEGLTIAAGTGVSQVVIGAEKNLVVAIDNNAGVGITAPIVDNGGGASGVTIVGTAGTGGVTLGGDNAYTGVTTVDGTATTGSRTLLGVTHNNALGTTAGGTVLIGGLATADGPRITLGSGITVTGETLTIRTGGAGTRSTLTHSSTFTSAWHGNIVVDANEGFGQIFANGSGGVMTIGADATNTLILNGGTTLRGTGTGTVNSTISGTGALGKLDAGTWTLTAANTYTGATNINVGTLALANLGALGGNNPGVNGTSGITIGTTAGATLSTTTTGITIYAPITTANTGINSAISFSRSTADAGSLTLNGAIGGAGNVVFTTPDVSGGGNVQTINLATAATYAGNTTISAGNANNATSVKNTSGAANVLPVTTVLTLSGGTGAGSGRTVTFDLNGQNQELAGLQNTTAADRNQRVTSTAPATLTINNSADYTFGNNTTGADPGSGQLTGAIALTKKGVGTFTLASGIGHTHTGKTVVEAGILSVGNTNSLQNSAFDTTNSILGDATNGLRTTVTTLTLGGLSGNKNLADVFTTTTGGYDGLTALTLNPGSGTTPSYSGNIADGATGMTLTKSGAGTQTLSGVISHTGATAVNAGTLVLDYSTQDNSKLSDTAPLILGGGTLDLSGGTHTEIVLSTTLTTGTASRVTRSSGTAVLQMGTITPGGGATIDFGAPAIATTDKLNNAYGILGTWAMVDGGFAVNSTNGAGGLLTAVVSSDVTRLNGGTQVIANSAATNVRIIEGTGTAADLTLAAATTTINTLAQSATGGTSAATIDSGTQTLRTNAILVGTGAGALTLGNGTLTPAVAGGDLELANVTAASGFTVNSVIADFTSASSLTKTGSGVVTLSADNTYTGATTVNFGTLSLTHNNALGTTAGTTTINGGNGTNAVTLSLSSATSDLTVAEPLNFFGNTAGRAQLVNDSAQNHTLSGPINVSSDTNVSQFDSDGSGSITVSGDITGTFTNNASLFLRGTSTSATNQVTGSLNLTGANLSKTDPGTWTVGALGETYSWTNTSLFVGTLKMSAVSVLPSTTVLTMGNSTGASTPTLDLNGFSQTIGGINYSGEGASTGTRTITSAAPAVLTVNNATDFLTTGTNVSTNNVVLTGALALIKAGVGKLELNGVNTNSGDTTVNDGILSLTKAASALDANTGNDASTVSIAAAAGAILDLAYTGTDEVDKLFIGGVQKAPGVWGSSTSGAPNTDAKFTGSGTLTVASGPGGFSSWITGTFANGTVPLGQQGPNADFDNDGISNLVEYAIAGQDPTVGSTTISTFDGTTLSFTKRGDASGLTYAIQDSTDLGLADAWAEVSGGSYTNNATTISYALTPGTPAKNFLRLQVLSN